MPVFVDFVSEIETVSLQSCFEPVCIIDERQSAINIVFLPTLSEEHFG